jgi:hypothetical protein
MPVVAILLCTFRESARKYIFFYPFMMVGI